MILIDFAIAALIAATLMFSVVIVGRLIQRFNDFIISRPESKIGRKILIFIIDRICFVGTIFHELSHALFAILTGAKVIKIRCFVLFSKNKLGYVEFLPQGGKIKQAVQKSLVSCAPVMTAFITTPIFVTAIINHDMSLAGKLFCAYCSISILCHASMSKADLELYSKGTIWTYPILIAIIFVIRFLFFR